MKKNIKITCKNALVAIAILALSFWPFVTASGDSGIFFDTVTTTTPLSDLSPGQQLARDAIGSRCAASGLPGSIPCQLQAGMDGVSAQNFSPQAVIQSETIAITSPYQYISSINERLRRLIAGGPFANLSKANQQSSLMLHAPSATAGGSFGNAYGFVGPWGISISGGGSFGNRHSAQGQTGFQLDTRQANLIVDYTFNQKLIGGFSFGYLGTDRDLKLNSGSLNSDSYRFAPFLLYRPTTNSYLSVMGGYALVNFDSTRRVKQSGNIVFENATARYDADQFFASVSGGYTFTLMDGWNLRGYGRGDYSHTDIERYLESGGLSTDITTGAQMPWALQVSGQNIRSVTSTVGAELTHAISTKSLAAVIIPSLRAEWVHEFENDSRTIGAGYQGNGVGATVPTFGQMTIAGPQRNWANLGAGLQILFPRAIVGYINYHRLIIKHANNNVISGGIRVNF